MTEANTEIAKTLTPEQRVSALVEAVPYIEEFSGSVVVVKIGGSVLIEPGLTDTFAKDIVSLRSVGINLVVVHGGGPQINAALAASGKKSEFVDGMRVTDPETLEVARSVVVGTINRDIANKINSYSQCAIGLSGEDAGLLQAELLDPELGLVGKVTDVDTTIITKAHEANLVPVVSSLAFSSGQTLNVNADAAASALAVALGARKIVFLTDVPGLLENPEDRGTLISDISLKRIKKSMANGEFHGGMVPKLNACIDSLDNGVRSAHFLDGNVPHSILLELLTNKGIGTMITKEVGFDV